MTLVYKCSECGKVIDHLETEGVSETALGLNVLTAEERQDIIETKADKTYVNVICDECAEREDFEQGVNSFQIH
jgi:ribosomal protein L44E